MWLSYEGLEHFSIWYILVLSFCEKKKKSLLNVEYIKIYISKICEVSKD